jgi:hypothetical protein
MVLIAIASYPTLQLIAHKSKNNGNKKQEQDFKSCIDKSMQNLLNGDLNFSHPDIISHCFDQPLKNETNSDGNNNDISNNSTFYNV